MFVEPGHLAMNQPTIFSIGPPAPCLNIERSAGWQGFSVGGHEPGQIVRVNHILPVEANQLLGRQAIVFKCRAVEKVDVSIGRKRSAKHWYRIDRFAKLFLDTLAKDFILTARFFVRAFTVIDIESRAIPLNNLRLRVERGSTSNQPPAITPVAPLYADLLLQRLKTLK